MKCSSPGFSGITAKLCLLVVILLLCQPAWGYTDLTEAYDDDVLQFLGLCVVYGLLGGWVSLILSCIWLRSMSLKIRGWSLGFGFVGSSVAAVLASVLVIRFETSVFKRSYSLHYETADPKSYWSCALLGAVVTGLLHVYLQTRRRSPETPTAVVKVTGFSN